jgi:replicative DNA helicase
MRRDQGPQRPGLLVVTGDHQRRSLVQTSYVAAVATATQTPPDLAGILALAVLATVAAGAVEVQPRPGWREPLCLFVAVGMDAGTRKSSVFTALTRPVADFERQQAATTLPAITETATLRRIADRAAAAAEASSSDEARPGCREAVGDAPQHLAGPPPRPTPVQPVG